MMDVRKKRLNILGISHLFAVCVDSFVYPDGDVQGCCLISEGAEVFCVGGWFNELKQFFDSHEIN